MNKTNFDLEHITHSSQLVGAVDAFARSIPATPVQGTLVSVGLTAARQAELERHIKANIKPAKLVRVDD